MQAAVHVDILVFIPGKAAGDMLLEERSPERLDALELDVDQRQRQSRDEFDALDERAHFAMLAGDQTAATFDRLAPALDCRHPRDRVGLHVRIDGAFAGVFPRLAGWRRRTGRADRQPLRQSVAPVGRPPHGEQATGLTVHLNPQRVMFEHEVLVGPSARGQQPAEPPA